MNEERKIIEKKNHNLVKDLKRQLVSEQQRNEKLSDKMKELLTDPPSFSGKSFSFSLSSQIHLIQR